MKEEKIVNNRPFAGKPSCDLLFIKLWAIKGKLSRHSKTMEAHRRNDKSECQECTCKIDKSLNRGMCIKFESRKNCVAGKQCDNSDFDFYNAEHEELPVVKILFR